MINALNILVIATERATSPKNTLIHTLISVTERYCKLSRYKQISAQNLDIG